MAKKYSYSKHTAPKNWSDLAAHLKSQPKPKLKKSGNSLHARLDAIEKLLKDNK